MVEAANHDRGGGGVKVGGHQASSASMAGVMTSLWFDLLGADHKVAVKPHASPVYHAIKYLTGEIDGSWLTRLRAFGGLQAYPSRTWRTSRRVRWAMVRWRRCSLRRRRAGRGRRVGGGRRSGPAGLGNVMWAVDLNRQSLDRVIPELKVRRLEQLSAASGWHVTEATWGRRISERFAAEGGGALRCRLDEMSNEEYRGMVASARGEVRTRLLAGADPAVKAAVVDVDDEGLWQLVTDLGSHDHDVLAAAPRCSTGCSATASTGWPPPTATRCTCGSPRAPSTRHRSTRPSPATASTPCTPACWPGRTCCVRPAAAAAAAAAEMVNREAGRGVGWRRGWEHGAPRGVRGRHARGPRRRRPPRGVGGRRRGHRRHQR